MRKFVYADESGNFDFSRNRGASRYFVLATVVLEDHVLSDRLTQLRRDLAWKGVDVPDGFHATTDSQNVRDAVFNVLGSSGFRIDATIIDKPKTLPRLKREESRFYQYAWYYHMKYVAPRVVDAADELMVVAATIGTKKARSTFQTTIRDVMSQVSPTSSQSTLESKG